MTIRNPKQIYSLSLLAQILAFALCYTVLPVVLSSVIDQFGLSGNQGGLISSVQSLGAMVGQLSIFYFQRHLRKFTMLQASGAAIVAAMAGMAVSPTAGVMMIIALVLGMAFGIFDSYCNSYIVEINGKNSGKYLGALHGLYGLGSVAAPPAIFALLQTAGWRACYVIAAVAMVLLVVQFGLVGKWANPRIEAVSKKEDKISAREFKSFFSSAFNVLMLLIMVLYTMMQSGLTLWVVRYVSLTLGNTRLAPIALSLFWLFAAAGRFTFPRLAKKPLHLFTITAFITAAAAAAGALSGSAALMCVACAVCGLTGGHGIPTIINYFAGRFSGNTTLPVTSMTIMMYAGSMLMPLVMGGVMTAYGLQSAMLAPPVMIFLGGIIAAALLRTGKA